MVNHFSFSFGLVPVLKAQIQHSGVDFRIERIGGEIFGDMAMQAQEIIKLPQRPDTGFFHMDGRPLEFANEIGQIQIGDVRNEFNHANFRENPEFVQSYGQCLLGALGEICKPAVVQERGDVTLKNDALSISRDHASPSKP